MMALDTGVKFPAASLGRKGRLACGAEVRREAVLSWGAGEDLADFTSFRQGKIAFTDSLQKFFFEFLSLPPQKVTIFSKKGATERKHF